jgi:hypothetical protein
MKDVQATGEAFRPQKKKSSTSKHEISSFFPIFGSVWTSWIRIRIPNVDLERTDQNQFRPGSTTLDDGQGLQASNYQALLH